MLRLETTPTLFLDLGLEVCCCPGPNRLALHKIESMASFLFSEELDTEIREEKSNVQGVLIADSDGLCLSSKGQIKAEAAGFVAAITKVASQLEPNSTERPVIVLNKSDKT